MFETPFLASLALLPNGPGGPWPPIAQRLAVLLDALIEAVAPPLAQDRAWAPVQLRLWMALQQLAVRFARAAIRAAAEAARGATRPGTAPPRRSRPPEPDTPAAPPAPSRLPRAPRAPRPPKPRRVRARRNLPAAFAWLVRRVPAASAHAPALAAFLAEPETVALLARSAALTRLMTPLCRALAIPPPQVAPQVAPGRAGPHAAAPPQITPQITPQGPPHGPPQGPPQGPPPAQFQTAPCRAPYDTLYQAPAHSPFRGPLVGPPPGSPSFASPETDWLPPGAPRPHPDAVPLLRPVRKIWFDFGR